MTALLNLKKFQKLDIEFYKFAEELFDKQL